MGVYVENVETAIISWKRKQRKSESSVLDSTPPEKGRWKEKLRQASICFFQPLPSIAHQLMQHLWGNNSLLFQVCPMFYTLETAPALAAEQRYFSYLSLKIGLELNALLDQSVSRGNSKYNSSFYIIILNITRPKCSSYQLSGACKSCLSASWKPRGSLYLLAEAGLFSTG